MNTRGLFITGTDTDVGKTYVAGLIARELVASGVRVGAYKLACSGCIEEADGRVRWHDVDELSRSIGGGFESERICPQRFHAPLAPPVAARLEGKAVDAALLRSGARWWDGRVEILLIEGVGGLLCPLTENETIADLAVDLGYPLLIVAKFGLGTINHTLLTVEAARSRGLHVAGIVLNEADAGQAGVGAEENGAEIAKRTDAPVLGVIRHGERVSVLRDGRRVDVDWGALASASIRAGVKEAELPTPGVPKLQLGNEGGYDSPGG